MSHAKGRIVATQNPRVVRLTDNGKRKVLLRFLLGGIEADITLSNAEQLELELQAARVWTKQ